MINFPLELVVHTSRDLCGPYFPVTSHSSLSQRKKNLSIRIFIHFLFSFYSMDLITDTFNYLTTSVGLTGSSSKKSLIQLDQLNDKQKKSLDELQSLYREASREDLAGYLKGIIKLLIVIVNKINFLKLMSIQ